MADVSPAKGDLLTHSPSTPSDAPSFSTGAVEGRNAYVGDTEVTPVTASSTDALKSTDATQPAEVDKAALAKSGELSLDDYFASQQPASEKTPATVPNWDDPAKADFFKEFENVLGIPLREAYENYTQAVSSFQELQQRAQEQQMASDLRTLQDAWGVNQTELDTRVEAVLAEIEKMPPHLKAQVDSVEGIQLVWSRLDKGKSVASRQASYAAPKQAEPKYRKSQLREMMQRDPGMYHSLQAEIQRAYAAGQVLDDVGF
jgi:hypothetical protein